MCSLLIMKVPLRVRCCNAL